MKRLLAVVFMLALAGCSLLGKSTAPTSSILAGVTSTGSQMVIVGYSGAIRTSPDGTLWTPRTSGTRNNLNAIVWTGKLLVAVGDAVVLTSPDGVTWTSRSSGTGKQLRSVVWTGTQVVAVGDGTVLTSPDGIKWTTRIQDVAASLHSIAWTGDRLVAVGGGFVFLSKDGVSWRMFQDHEMAEHPDVTKVEHKTTPRTCSTSHQECRPDRLGGTPTCMSKFTSYDCSTTDDIVTTTSDLKSWGMTASLNAVVWTGTHLLAVGGYGTILSSPDGFSWAPVPKGKEIDFALYAVIQASNQLIAVGQNFGTDTRNVLTSPDGVTWTVHKSGATYGLNAVAWTGKQLVAVSDGAVFTSLDGATWIPGHW